jgi:hypothetical protein
MKLHSWSSWVSVVSAMALGIIVFVGGTRGGPQPRFSVPYDWSHQHLVFSQPSSVWQAAKLQQEPRYWQQTLRRNAAAHSRAAAPGADESQDSALAELRLRLRKSSLHRDWAKSLGSGASTGNTTYSQFPAKFTFDISPNSESCSDYVAFPTNMPGVTGTSSAVPGQPSIIAFQNLYSGTGGACLANPTIAWAYNTNAAGDTTGVVDGSPVLSADGKKVAFVESNSGGSVLHLLRYKLRDGTNLLGQLVTATPTHLLTSGSGWNACPNDGSSCMISLTFTAGTVSSSSPFYHYASDQLYVGDDAGVLHKFTGVFNGTPTEVMTGGWPITVNSGTILTPPIFDPSSNNIFVTDSSGFLSFVRDTGSTTGLCLAGFPPCLGSPSLQLTVGPPIVDAPLVDPSTEKVFAFVGDDGLGGASVVQANTDLTGAVSQTIGAGGAPLHTGAFDNTYLSSSPGSISGFMYVCGKNGATDTPALRQIGFDTSGTMNFVPLSRLPVGNVAGAAGQCSPVTEIFNSGTDFLFVSVQSGGLGTNCAGGGCVMSVLATGTFPTSIAASAAETGGSSGIVIDNIGSFGQDSSLYFSRLGQSSLSTCGGSGATLVGCAVKLTQSGLN